MLIATSEFEGLAREAAGSQGLPGVRIATVAHPIGGIDAAGLRTRAEAAVEAVLALVAGG